MTAPMKSGRGRGGSGVSVTRTKSGKWSLRWREPLLVDGERQTRQRQKTVSTEQAAIALRAKILRAVETGEIYETEARVSTIVCSFDEVGVAWLKSKKSHGATLSTRQTYAKALNSFCGAVRFLKGLAEDEPIPVSMLSLGLLEEVAAELRDPSPDRQIRHCRSTANGERVWYTRATPRADGGYRPVTAARSAWARATLEVAHFPGVPVPAPSAADLPVRGSLYTAPDAPTLAECDAVLRQLMNRRHAYVALSAAIVMRWTGLRVAQTRALRWTDLDVEALTLTLPAAAGKSRREKSSARSIPISKGMLSDLERACAAPLRDPVWVVPRANTRVCGAKTGSQPNNTIREAWRSATALGEVRRDVWDPPSRAVARPNHAFRAAIQAFWDNARVREAAIDVLVGHAPATTRRRHYAPIEPEDLRAAVDLLPPVNWDVEASPNRRAADHRS